MKIKKSTLRWAIPALLVIAVLGTIVVSSSVKKSKEERARQEVRDDIERRIDREYRSLKSRFDHYAETACDWDYSESTREHAAKKMYELTGLLWHNGWRTYMPIEMKEKIEERKDQIDRALRAKAAENVKRELLGE